ncbi:hypothetical protein B0H10DRAFT_1958854 [Mycena sp. CBHHK59/15]|nr:hypothetical protein B0H10DRAFT_1958854 [Mycena sp. CBHHK59/15]
MALNGQPPPARGSEQGLTFLYSGATLPDTEYIQGWFFFPPLFPVDRWLRTPLSAHGQSSGRGGISLLKLRPAAGPTPRSFDPGPFVGLFHIPEWSNRFSLRLEEA